MKKYILFSLLALTLYAQEGQEYWEGCGTTDKEAKEMLSQKILVEIETSDSSKINTKKNDYFTLSSTEVNIYSSQKSALLLHNLEQSQKNNLICYRQNKEDLKSYTQKRLENINRDYNIANITGSNKEKIATINQWLEELRILKGLSKAFPQIDSKQLNQKIAALKKLRNEIKAHAQSVQIILTSSHKGLISSSVVYIDDKQVQPSEKIYLKPGEHSYSIKGAHCPTNGSFELEPFENKTIEINLDDYAYPELTINANKPNVKLTIDGNSYPLGKTKIFGKCHGEVSYLLRYQDGEPSTEDGTVELEPDLQKTLSFTFYSNHEIKRLKNLKDSFIQGKKLEISYAYATVDPDIVGADNLANLHIFSLGYFFYGKEPWLRYGTRVHLGLGNENSFSLRAGGMVALQLAQFGSKKRVLHLGTLATFIPYVGLEAGLGYNKLYNEVTKDYESSFTLAGEDAPSSFEDYIYFQPLAGFDLVFDKSMALGVEVSKNLTMQHEYTVGVHLNLSWN